MGQKSRQWHSIEEGKGRKVTQAKYKKEYYYRGTMAQR